MYNRYINGGGFETPVPPEQPMPPPRGSAQAGPAFHNAEPAAKQGPLSGLFGGNFKLPEFDADTILLLVLVYFLISDSNEEEVIDENGEVIKKKGNISDTLLIIGALLLLGF